jgi:Cys-rich repeat protein
MVQSCTINVECRGGEICLGGICQAIGAGQCTSDDDCAPEEYCTADTHECVMRIRSGCSSDADCLEGDHCDLARRTCVECVEDLHCGPGQVCRSSMCVAAGTDAGIAVDAELLPDANAGPDAAVPSDSGGSTTDAGATTSCMTDSDCGAPRMICEANQCCARLRRAGRLDVRGGRSLRHDHRPLCSG